MSSSVEVAAARPRPTRAQAAVRSRRRGDFGGGTLGDSPWRNRDLVRLLVLQAIGGIGIAIAWYGSSDEVDFRDQSVWTALGLLAAIVAAIGGAGWLLTGLGAVSRERLLLRRRITELYGFKGQPTAEQAPEAPVDTSFVTAEGMRRYHRPSCDVVRGKATRPVPVHRYDSDSPLEPCRMCGA